jgi:hypothetical protein
MEEVMIETERKKLYLMQSMGNGREDWDTIYHFLTSLWEPINRLPENRQMFLCMKIQEKIHQETQKQKWTQSSTSLSQMQLFHHEAEDRTKEIEANT